MKKLCVSAIAGCLALNAVPVFSADEDHWGFIDKTGKMVIAANFANAGDFAEGLAPVEVNGKWGYIDKLGSFVIKPQYEEAHAFSEGLAAVTPSVPDEKTDVARWELANARRGKWGFIDKTGKLVIEPQFERVDCFKEGLAKVHGESDTGYINRDGKFVIRGEFESQTNFGDGLAAVSSGSAGIVMSGEQDGEYDSSLPFRFIDTSGKMVIPAQFNSVTIFSEGMAAVGLGHIQNTQDRWGFINKQGKLVIEPQFNAASRFSQGLAAVQTGHYNKLGFGYKSWLADKWGYINKNGKMVIASVYDGADPFSDNLASVKSGTKWGFIDSAGTLVISPQYKASGKFCDGLAPVETF